MIMTGAALAIMLAAPRMVVMPIAAGTGTSDKAAAFLTETLAGELRRQSGDAVLTPRDLGKLLPREKQVAGCASDECLAELAGVAGADRVVAGDVVRLGGNLQMELRLVDAKEVRVVGKALRKLGGGTYNQLVGVLPAMVKELLQAPAATAELAPPKAPNPARGGEASSRATAGDTVVLHYHRGDGRYANVQLITWESFEQSDELREPQSSILPAGPFNMPSAQGAGVPTVGPSGTDPFGVYWVLPAAKYRNGRVNFVIAVPGGFDECGGTKARFWILQDGREVWHVAPSCEVYTSRAAADRVLAASAGAKPSGGARAAPGLEPEAASAVLHYRRSDGKYDRFQLITWESFEGPDELRRPQAAIMPSLPFNVPSVQATSVPRVAPSGTDEFGVYWVLPAAKYRNGRVNFVISAGSGFDECGGVRARYWILGDGLEAWHTAPRCEVFVDREAALRSLRR